MAGREKEETGQNPTETRHELAAAAKILGGIAENWDERNQKPVTLLRALCHLTAETSGAQSPSFSFEDLARAAADIDGKAGVWGIDRNGNFDLDSKGDPRASRKVRIAFEDLLTMLQRKREGIEQAFRDLDWFHGPGLDKSRGGGRGNATQYCLILQTLSSQTDPHSTQSHPVPEGGLRYHTEDSQQRRWLTRAMSEGFLLSGWRAGFFVLLIFGSLLLSLLFGFVALAGILGWFPLSTTLAAVFLAAVVLAGGAMPLKRLVDDRMIPAPWWLQGIFDPYDDKILVLRRNEAQQANEVVLMRYLADCPICGSKVRIHPGRREFRGRFVGRCGRVPLEHVFTFDPYTRIGRPLR
ncbi:MAG: hypothetical protein R6U98_32655 [Pirellulaceae bacterium]